MVKAWEVMIPSPEVCSAVELDPVVAGEGYPGPFSDVQLSFK